MQWANTYISHVQRSDHPWAFTLLTVLFGTTKERLPVQIPLWYSSLFSRYHVTKNAMGFHSNANHLFQYLSTKAGAKQ